MKTIILYVSTHHGNTAKVAKVIGDVLSAEMHDLDKQDLSGLDLSKFDLIGLGSGIYAFGMDRRLFQLVERTGLKGRKVFLFSTSASGKLKMQQKLVDALAAKQADLVGQFMCPGFIDWAFFKWFGGGLRRGQPDAQDLEKARLFAESLKK
jgi:flavodoxin